MNLRLLPATALVLALSACGTGDSDDGNAADLPFGLGKAVHCMAVHGAGVQIALGPLAVSEDAAAAADIISGMRDTATSLPEDDTDLPQAMLDAADMLQGVAGKGIEVAGTLADNARYRAGVEKFAGWHKANCPTDEKRDAG